MVLWMETENTGLSCQAAFLKCIATSARIPAVGPELEPWIQAQDIAGTIQLADLRFDPDASMGKIPDTDAQALMTQTPDSPMELMYFSRSDGRYVWHALESVTDFDTSSKHTSSSFYCTNWHCDNGTIDSSACGSEGQGCPVTAHGIGGFYKKIYVDSNFSRHIRGMHMNGNMCGLPNYERASIWIYVR